MSLFVAVAVAATMWPVLGARALSFDDTEYIAENRLLQNPGWSSARQFLTEVIEPSTVRGYYQPLTMISLMLDSAVGGRADILLPFHRTSLLLHMLNTMLVVVFLYGLWPRPAAAAAAGLLFGLHPMCVEPIAWVSDRKTILAAFFVLSCLAFYVRYTKSRRRWIYMACLCSYLLALLSKPTSVPLPLLLLLLDHWPFRRLSWKTLVEKLPFVAMGAGAAIITLVSQANTSGVTLPTEATPLRAVLVVCHNIVFYMSKLFWPADMSGHYPFPNPLTASDPGVLLGLVGSSLLMVIVVVSCRWTRSLATGSLFFLAAIFPALGVVGFTKVIAADKFLYLPALGVLLVLTRIAIGIWDSSPGAARRVVLVLLLLVIATAEAVESRGTLHHWQDSGQLFRYMMTIAPDAPAVHFSLGNVLFDQGKIGEAEAHFRDAIRLKQDYDKAHIGLGNILLSQNRPDDAIQQYAQALKFNPYNVGAHNNLGNALMRKGRIREAGEHYRKALDLKPDHVKALTNLGAAHAELGESAAAAECYRKAILLNPNDSTAYGNLANTLLAQDRVAEALEHYRTALRLNPDNALAHNNIGGALLRQGDTARAIQHYRHALRLMPRSAIIHMNLGDVLLEADFIEQAIAEYSEAVRLDPQLSAAREKIAAARTKVQAGPDN